MDYCPDHLRNIINSNFSGIDIKDKNWFNECHFKGKICFNGIEKFKILFTGNIVDNYIVNNKNAFIVNILPIGTIEKIVIFDERYHGYNALLIEDLTNKKVSKEIPFIDKDGKNIFEIVIWANYSVDFEDELPNKKELKLLNGKIDTIKNIKRNAFDSFGIIIKNELGNVYNILEMELM
jgi:hypothetical protein